MAANSSRQESPAAAAFHFTLIHELTELDRRESATEIRHRIPENIYRLGHYLGAAQRVEDAIQVGSDPATAFSEAFTPTRGMHRIAKNLGLRLDVDHGRWVSPSD